VIQGSLQMTTLILERPLTTCFFALYFKQAERHVLLSIGEAVRLSCYRIPLKWTDQIPTVRRSRTDTVHGENIFKRPKEVENILRCVFI
jgi:hypothetical protein